MQPFEIVAAPYTLWLAPTSTAFPEIDDLEGAFDPGWVKVGTSGDKNYGEDGVTVSHEQEIARFVPAGSTAARKAWRTSEGLMIGVPLVDVSATQYAQALNDAAITTIAAASGVAGEKTIELLQGLDVSVFSLLARGKSPEDETLNAQYQVPIVYQGENLAPQYRKGEPATLVCQFAALEDDTDGFGKLRLQTGAAL